MSTRTVSATDAARAMDALRRIVHALHAANARSESRLQVTAAQLFVMRQIAAEPGISISGLAQRTRSAPSSVSEVVARLVSEGLVERKVSAGDGRRAELTLTRSGLALASRAEVTIQERLVAAFESLPPDDRSALATLMESWLGAAGLGETPATFFFEKD